MAVVNTHPDVWIMKDLWTIAIYYPENQLSEEDSILDTQTIFVDYQSAADDEIKELGIRASSSSWKLKNAPEGFIDNPQISAYAPAHQWILKGQEWVKYLVKTGSKPETTIYNQDLYDKIIEVHEQGFGINFQLPSGKKIWIRFPKIFHGSGSGNRHTDKTLADDIVASEHSPLSYFPQEVDLSKTLFYDPLLGTAELSKFYQWYGPIFGNIIFQYCASHGRKIFYSEIVTFNKYDINVDFSIFGLNNKYTIPFNGVLERYLDPFAFFKKEVSDQLEGTNLSPWPVPHSERGYPLVFAEKRESGGEAHYIFDVYDYSMTSFDNTDPLRVRDGYIQNFMRCNCIPLNKPEIDEYGTIAYYPDFYERMIYPMHLEPQTNWAGLLQALKLLVGIAVTIVATIITAGAAAAAIAAFVAIGTIILNQVIGLITSNPTVKMIAGIGIAAATAKILSDGRKKSSSQTAKIDTKKIIKEAVVGSLDAIENWTKEQYDGAEAIDTMIENLDRKESEKLIQILAEIANRRAVAETPHGHGFVVTPTVPKGTAYTPAPAQLTGPSLMPLAIGGALAYLLLKK